MDTKKITDPLNRGMVAGLLGMPADMLNMLRNAGRSVQNLTLMAQNKPTIPMQQDPAYGQEWWGNKMQQMGYVTPNRNPVAEFGAGLLDPTGIADTLAAKAPMLAQGLFNLGDPALMTVTKGLLSKKAYDVAPDVARAAAKNLSAPATLNKPGFAGQRGAIVWHGSPHTFDAFDSSKIGTGEGAQAYGHGLYFAESPDVAKGYAESVSRLRGGGSAKVTDGAKSVDIPVWAADKIKQDGIESVISEWEKRAAESAAAAKTSLQPWIEQANAARLADQAEQLKGLRNAFSIDPPGSLYKVDLPDDAIAKMLDWDKPLSQQAPEVQRAIGGAADDATGMWLYNTIAGKGIVQRKYGGEKGAVEAYLRDQGIPGIRYLDGGSRGTGSGTSNFVVFPGNEGLLKILERNGKPLK